MFSVMYHWKNVPWAYLNVAKVLGRFLRLKSLVERQKCISNFHIPQPFISAQTKSLIKENKCIAAMYSNKPLLKGVQEASPLTAMAHNRSKV